MIFAVDVDYKNEAARAAGILFSDWSAPEPESTLITIIQNIEPYEPGFFYKRELPCIPALLKKVPMPLETIIVDGYVTLGKENKPGLGMYLHQSLETSTPIIGVAKKSFKDTPEECKLWRGQSKNPLYITSVAMSLKKAKSHIKNMHGQHRIPTLLKSVDQLCRSQNP